MSKFDRYVLSQYLLIFGFFALILVAVFWINRAVSLFDRLIADGQSALVFLEFTALALPNLIRMVVPMAAFAATVFVTNRLNSESELTVMQATGSSPWQLARPAVTFGLILAVLMGILTHVLLPASIRQLEVRQAEVARSATAALLTEGQFLHPAKGVTFFIRQIDPDGTLNDVFLSDRRRKGESVTYTASRAFLVRDEERASLIMVDGLAQSMDSVSRELSTTTFADFSYDITPLIQKTQTTTRNIRAIPTPEMLRNPAGITQSDGYTPGQIAEELHLRFARALICIAVALVGFSTLLLGGFSRFGVWRQILIAFVLLVMLELMRGVVSEPVLDNARLWPLIYLPTMVGIVVGTLFLYLSAHPRKRVTPPESLGAPEGLA